MELPETRHATARRQGRGIPAFVVNLLLEQGACTRHGGADNFYVDREARRRIRRTLGDCIHAAIESYLDAYVVLGDDGRVITAAWRRRASAAPDTRKHKLRRDTPPCTG